MGLILDTSILIAAERQRFDLPRFFADHGTDEFFLAAITVSELLQGVVRAPPGRRRDERAAFVEGVISEIDVIDVDLPVARRHAIVWAAQEEAGSMIGAYDLLIAATALHHDHGLATLNTAEFGRVRGLRLVETQPYCRG